MLTRKVKFTEWVGYSEKLVFLEFRRFFTRFGTFFTTKVFKSLTNSSFTHQHYQVGVAIEDLNSIIV